MEYITDNLDYHHICELNHIHTQNFVISDIEHYLQHSHGDGRIFVSGNVVGKQMDYSYILRTFRII